MAVDLTPESEKLLSNLGSERRGFASCNITFDGKHDTKAVKSFLRAATDLKKVEKISDEDALKDLHVLLKGDAATWWNEAKGTVNSWDNLRNRLHRDFATKRPAFIVYEEIISRRQGEFELTKSFIKRQRKLFAQIPTLTCISQQLDILYKQLNSRIRERLTRDSVKTYEELLKAASAIENPEKASDNVTETKKPAKKKRLRCNFCRMAGHAAEVCIKKAKAVAESPDGIAVSRKPKAVTAEPQAQSELKDSSDNTTNISVASVMEASSTTQPQGQTIDIKAEAGRTNEDGIDTNEPTTAISGTQDFSTSKPIPAPIDSMEVKVEEDTEIAAPSISHRLLDLSSNICGRKSKGEASTMTGGFVTVTSTTEFLSSAQPLPSHIDFCRIKVEGAENSNPNTETGNTSEFANSGNKNSSSAQPLPRSDISRTQTNVETEREDALWRSKPTTVASKTPASTWSQLLSIRTTDGYKKITNAITSAGSISNTSGTQVFPSRPLPDHNIDIRRIKAKVETGCVGFVSGGFINSSKSISASSETLDPSSFQRLPNLTNPSTSDICRRKTKVEAGSAEGASSRPTTVALEMPATTWTQSIPGRTFPSDEIWQYLDKKAQEETRTASGIAGSSHSTAVSSGEQSPSWYQQQDSIPSSDEIIRRQAIEAGSPEGFVRRSSPTAAPSGTQVSSSSQRLPDYTIPSSAEICHKKARKTNKVRRLLSSKPTTALETPADTSSQRILDHTIRSSSEISRKKAKVETKNPDVFVHRKKPTSLSSGTQMLSSSQQLPSPIDIRDSSAEAENPDALVRRSKPSPVASGKQVLSPSQRLSGHTTPSSSAICSKRAKLEPNPDVNRRKPMALPCGTQMLISSQRLSSPDISHSGTQTPTQPPSHTIDVWGRNVEENSDGFVRRTKPSAVPSGTVYQRLPWHRIEVEEEAATTDGWNKPMGVSVGVQAPSPPFPEFACYGCGAPGVMRSKCYTCTRKQEESTALRDAQAKVRELTKKTEDLEQQKMEYQRKITVLERMNEELVQSNYEYSKKLALIMSKDKVVRPPKKTILLEEPVPKTSSTAGGEAPEKKPRGSTKSGKSQGVTTKGGKKRPHPESSPPEPHTAPIEASADTHKATDYALNLDLLPVKTEPDPLEDPPVVSTTYINPLGGSTTYIDPLKDPGTIGTTLANLLSEPSTKFIESLGDTGAFVSPLAAIASTLESGSERFTLYGEANNGLISVENIKIEEDITIVEHNLEEEERYTVVVTEH